MRILMLSDYFPPHLGGGVERVASELCARLVKRGHVVTVVTFQTVPAPSAENDGALTVYRVPALDLTSWLGLQQMASMSILSSAARYIHSFKPDIVHAHNLFFRTSETAALLKIIFNVPLVTTLHLGRLEDGSKLLKRLVRLYELTMGSFIVRRSNHLIAVSDAVAQHAGSLRDGSTPVTVIPNGVDAELFHPIADRNLVGPTVLFTGRLIPNKGPETLINAIPEVLTRHPQARFLFAGEGPLRGRLEQRVSQLGVGPAVEFLGLRQDVPELMRNAALFVRPSTLEGMPLTVLEAMASAIPVVATPVGGTPEIIQDDVCGHLSPVGDSSALANAVSRLLDDRAKAEEMGRRGRTMIESRYTWERVAEETEQIYIKVRGR